MKRTYFYLLPILLVASFVACDRAAEAKSQLPEGDEKT